MAPTGSIALGGDDLLHSPIEADALACTRDEIDALFAQRGVDASVTQIDSVHQRTLGWPAAAGCLNSSARCTARWHARSRSKV